MVTHSTYITWLTGFGANSDLGYIDYSIYHVLEGNRCGEHQRAHMHLHLFKQMVDVFPHFLPVLPERSKVGEFTS